MILPDGEAISINHPDISINNAKMVMSYLNMLNEKVTPLPIESVYQPTESDMRNIAEMRRQVENVAREFNQTHIKGA